MSPPISLVLTPVFTKSKIVDSNLFPTSIHKSHYAQKDAKRKTGKINPKISLGVLKYNV